jgi:hypothetical protein
VTPPRCAAAGGEGEEDARGGRRTRKMLNFLSENVFMKNADETFRKMLNLMFSPNKC